MQEKAELRKLIRDKRKSLTADQQLSAATGLLQQLQSVSEFIESDKVAMYLINDGEIDPVKVMHWCWANHRKTFVPIVVQDTIANSWGNETIKNSLQFAAVTKQTRFQPNKYGINEPVVEQQDLVQARDLDLVLMPLVAFDSGGNRVGMGGGFYDTTFEFKKNNTECRPHLIGIAHEIQRVENITAQYWDIPLATVVTDKQIYCLSC